METMDRIKLELNYYRDYLNNIEAKKLSAIIMYTFLNYDEEANRLNKELDSYSKLIDDEIKELNSMIQEFVRRKQKVKSHLNNLNIVKNNIDFTKEEIIPKEELENNLFPKIDFSSCLIDPYLNYFYHLK